jgi:hypothetical protein
MKADTNLNRSLRRVFRTYDKEKQLEAAGKELSPWRKQQLAMDERRLFQLQQRDNETENRVDKRAASGKPSAGIFAIRDKGSVEEKLRKAFGGKVAKRVLQRERLAARERPDHVRIFVEQVVDGVGSRTELTRGVDFAVVPPPHGEPTLVLHDDAKEFTVEYAEDFPHTLT